MPKDINLKPQSKLKTGLDKVADTVKLTIGPKGRNVAVDRGVEPLISNDGGTIAAEIQLKDPVENMGAQIIRGVIRKTSDKVGGGRTASAILTQALVGEGMHYAQFGLNLNAFKRGMQESVQDITINLKKNAKEVQSQEELEQVATISTESAELGKTIAEVVHKTGKDSIVTIEESQTMDITTEVVEGIKFDKGWISPYMVTNPERMEAVLKDTPVLVADRKISMYKDLFPIIQAIADKGKNTLFVVCEDLDGEALANSVMMKLRGAFTLVAVKYPLIGKDEWLDDIARSAKTEIVSERTGVTLENVELGSAKKVIVSRDSTVLMGSADLSEHIRNLKLLMENTDNLVEKDKLEKRIAVLTGGIAVIKVGAATEAEMKYLKQKIEDGVNETKRALEEGIVAGGDVAFINASKGLKMREVASDEDKGYNTVLKAITEPFKQIIRNAQGEAEVILNEVRNSKDTDIGYDVLSGELKNMVKSGIIDAVKVTRTVLENAVSGAGMFLSVEATVTEEQEEKPKLEY